MKKIKEILIILTMITGLFSSCKKYDYCCETSGYNLNYKEPTEAHSCWNELSKKEYDNKTHNNEILDRYNYMKGNPNIYTNVEYSCE